MVLTERDFKTEALLIEILKNVNRYYEPDFFRILGNLMFWKVYNDIFHCQI